MLTREEIVTRLALAAVFGAVVGLERERKNWTAGMRTHMMVCLGAALMMMVSSFGFSDILKKGDHIALDPSRIAAQVVSGIGFIGAGTIMYLKQGIVKGLTTAAGLWTVAGIGLACGGGMYFAAVLATLFALVILWGVQPIEKRFVQRYARRVLQLTLTDTVNPMQMLDEWFHQERLKLANLVFDKVNKEIVIEIEFHEKDNQAIMEVIHKIKENPAVKEIVWRR